MTTCARYVRTYVQSTGTCAMATVEFRWKERVNNLIALLDERLCLYNTKLRDYFNRDKKKALDEIATVLGITGKLRFIHACLIRLLRSMIAMMTVDATAACFLLKQYAILPRVRAQLSDVYTKSRKAWRQLLPATMLPSVWGT